LKDYEFNLNINDEEQEIARGMAANKNFPWRESPICLEWIAIFAENKRCANNK
jgi:hypothetical protein